MIASKRAFLDTNVVLRALVSTAPLHQEADTLVKMIRRQGYELWISRQVIREFIAQITRPQSFIQPVSIAELEHNVNLLQQLFQIADETAQVTDQLMILLKATLSGGKQVHDVNIVATMLTYGIDTLLTQNIEDMRRFSDKIVLIPLMKTTP